MNFWFIRGIPWENKTSLYASSENPEQPTHLYYVAWFFIVHFKVSLDCNSNSEDFAHRRLTRVLAVRIGEIVVFPTASLKILSTIIIN